MLIGFGVNSSDVWDSARRCATYWESRLAFRKRPFSRPLAHQKKLWKKPEFVLSKKYYTTLYFNGLRYGYKRANLDDAAEAHVVNEQNESTVVICVSFAVNLYGGSRMKNATRKSWCLIPGALILALLAAGPLAAQTTTLNLTGAGPGEIVWGTSEGIYTSPYTGNVGGPTIPVICDDFADNTFLPESWTAYVTQLSTLTSTTDPTLKWTTGDFGTLTQQAAYTVASVLAVEILNPANTPTAQEELSFAMWALFDPNGAGGSDQGALGWLTANNYQNTPGSFYANVLTDLNNAVTYASSSANASQVLADVNATTIYSYDPANGVWGCNGCSGPPQEFIAVNMAEPASPALLGFDLLCVAGLIFFVRRRFTGSMNLN